MTTALVKLQTRTMKALEAKKDRGATAVEYGIMVAFIAVGIVLAVTALRGQLQTLFGQVTTALTTP